jgi:DNA-binding phage protein
MALTRDFRESVQARVKRDPAFRKGLLSEAIESLLSGEVALGKELLRDYINATVGFPKLAAHTKLHVKTLHQMFGPNGNPTANNLFEIVSYLQRAEGVRFELRTARASQTPVRRTLAWQSQRFRHGWTLSQHGNGVADSLPFGSGNLDVQLGRQRLPFAYALCALELSQSAVEGSFQAGFISKQPIELRRLRNFPPQDF